MALTDTELAIAAAKRLKWPPSKVLSLQSMIPAALSNLAKQTARDPARRNMLMTDPDTVTADIVAGMFTSAATAQTGSADLSDIVATYGIMLDTLRYGSIFQHYELDFTSGDVTTGTWPAGAKVEFFNDEMDVLSTGDPIFLTTTGTVPGGLQANRLYYAIVSSPYVGFALTAALAEAGTGIDISGAGTGNSTINTPDVLMQLLKSPNQGLAETCLPFSMFQGWLEEYTLKVKGKPFNLAATGKLTFNVPFVPTLETFPVDYDLQQDLLDTLVAAAATMAIQDEPPAD